jgi:hypothetical protein
MDSFFLQFEHFPANKQQLENIYDKVHNNHMIFFSTKSNFNPFFPLKQDIVDGFHVIRLPFNRATFLCASNMQMMSVLALDFLSRQFWIFGFSCKTIYTVKKG